MKKFGSKSGFTLVELIVVIAILGILAGIAVPAYSGYMDSAREAADIQTLSVVNTAFGAACADNGLNPDDVTASISGNSINVTVPSTEAADIKASFDTFFDGNTIEWEYYESAPTQANGENGLFGFPDDSTT